MLELIFSFYFDGIADGDGVTVVPFAIESLDDCGVLSELVTIFFSGVSGLGLHATKIDTKQKKLLTITNLLILITGCFLILNNI